MSLLDDPLTQNRPRPPSALTIDVAKIRGDLDDIYSDLANGRKRTEGARWAACVRRLEGIERRWLGFGWISEGSFKSAVVLHAYLAGQTVGPRSTTASLLLMLTTDIEGRQQRSTWARALQEVLDGHLGAEDAAEMAVSATLAASRSRQKTEKQRAAWESEKLKRLRSSSPLSIRPKPKPKARKSTV